MANIAYLISQYPAPSHTFIRREVDALRDRGLDIQTYSVRAPLSEEVLSEIDRNALETTWYLLPVQLQPFISAHVVSLVRQPVQYLRTLRLAFTHRTPGFSLKPVFYFAEAIYLAEELKRRNITHLHNHFAQAGAIVGLLASHYLKIKWSFTVHGTSEFDGAAGALLEGKLAAAEFVPCVSYFGRAQVMRLVHPRHWPKLFINRCGVDLGNMPHRIENQGKTIHLLTIARLSPEKGLIGLLEAFALALTKNKHLRLEIIGDGPEYDNIVRKISDLNIHNKCTLLGRASETEVFQKLATTDILVTSSFMEGLPVVLMEALAMNVPVIAPSVAGIPELITDGESGLLFSPSNWEQLSACISRLSLDHDLRQELAHEGRRRVEERFDIKVAIEPLLEKLSA